MPEGPEIRRAADRLAEVLVDRPLTGVWFGHKHLQRFADELANSSVVNVRTKGKALLTGFACGLTVYSHNQLYGRWYVMPAGDRPETKRQLRWALETETQSALLYSASDIAVMRDDALSAHPFLARAGIDVLSDMPEIAELSRYIGAPRFARRSLGGLLLDQSFVAGVGNYLRSEILFCARLDPNLCPGELNGHQRRRLAIQTIRIIQRAYETGGITCDPKQVRNLQRLGWSRSRYRHYVFSRANAPCHICGATITRRNFAGRRLYVCPTCQSSDHAISAND